MTDRYGGEREDLRTDWPRYCAGGGALLALVFGWFMLTAEAPWREQDRAVAPGKWLVVDIQKRPRWASFEYEIDGRSHRGEIRCDTCLGNLRERPSPGATMSVEYRLADPRVSRPFGLVTEGAAGYRRMGFIAGIALLAVGLLGLALGAGRRRDG
jgi:hypothetical protein